VHDIRAYGGDEADSAHVCGQVVDLVNAFRGPEAVLPDTQVEGQPFRIVLFLDVVVESCVSDSDEVALPVQFVGEMASDEAASSSYQDSVQVSFTPVLHE